MLQVKRMIRLEIAVIETEKSRYGRVGSRKIVALRHRGGVAECWFCPDTRVRPDERSYGPAGNCAWTDCPGSWVAWADNHVSRAIGASVHLGSGARATRALPICN